MAISSDSGALRQRLAEQSGPARVRTLLELIRAQVATTLGTSEAKVPVDRSFEDLGLDSMAAVTLADLLTGATGVEVPAIAVFDHATPLRLAEHLRDQLVGGADDPLGGKEAAAEEPPRVRGGGDEPIAIVAMSCRLPGGIRSPEEFWTLLAGGGDAIGPFPEDRGWPREPTGDYSRTGGFLHDVAEFDATLFRISPREALAMDPQQRLLLENTWELLERAGMDPTGLRGSRTGLFAGVVQSDYAVRRHEVPDELAGYVMTGNASSVIPGRVAYVLGLRGPVLAVDTACSSSLVALHLAARSLRLGECDLALAGGVTVMSSPLVFDEFGRQQGLAADGRCKAFADAADGTAWSEGVGMLALQRLGDARRDGRRVLAVLRGSAMNHDGDSNGLTAPNGLSQRRLIADALRTAGLKPDEVDAVEAHGTGTKLGDPIEARALLAAYGQRRARPLFVGSVKSNIGHTQAAAGVAGVIKMVLAIEHGMLPRTLHVDLPSSLVDWSAGDVELLTERRDWPSTGRPRRAAVSSFGLSGTNAHVLVEQDTGARHETGPGTRPEAGPLAWVLSGHTPAALAGQARRLRGWLDEHAHADLAAVAVGLATTRAGLGHRAVVLGRTRAELLAGLDAVAGGRAHPDVVTGHVQEGELAFAFTGQGAQRSRMGAGLRAGSPVFAAALDEVCAAVDPHLDRRLGELLAAEPGSADAALLDETTYTQPALFAVEVALARLLDTCGVRPDHVVGHSVGEIVAAHVAGVLSLADAATLVTARGRLMGALPPGGAMLAIDAAEDELDLPAGVGLAAVNGPSSVVISGDRAALVPFAERYERSRWLAVSHAFHSPLMDPMLAELRRVVAELTLHHPRIPLSTTGDVTDPEYWVRNARETVWFAENTAALTEAGVTRFLEIGPDAVLTTMIEAPVVAPVLRRDRDEERALYTALAVAHAAGVPVGWPALLPSAKPAPLPTYAFDRARYWLPPVAAPGDLTAAGQRDAGHPLAGSVVELPGDALLITGRISVETHPWLADHAVRGTVVVPGAALAELALRAGALTGCTELAELLVRAPLTLPARTGVLLRVTVGAPDEDGLRALTIHGRLADAPTGAAWTTHATGALGLGAPPRVASMALWPAPGAEPLVVDGAYERLAERGYRYGPAFQGLRAAWRRGQEIFAEVALPEGLGADGFAVHPALLDAALHAVGLATDADDADTAALPFEWSGVRLSAPGATVLRVRLTRLEGGALSAAIADEHGALVAVVRRLAFLPVEPEQLRTARQTPLHGLHRLGWTHAGGAVAETDRLGVVDDPELAAALAAAEFAELDAIGDDVPATVVLPVRDPGPDRAAAAHRLTRRVLAAVRHWLAEPRFAGARLAVLTTNACATAAGEPADPAAAAVAGLLRSAVNEHPGRFAHVDVDDPHSAAPLVPAAIGVEPQTAVRAGAILVPRLCRAGSAAGEVSPAPDGVVLITGGAAGLGGVLARHLAERHGVRRLVLATRGGPRGTGVEELSAELARYGTTLDARACDVTEREQVAALVAEIRPATVVHLAGTLDDGLVDTLTTERLDAVLRPKVDGAWHLHELLDADTELVLFSSAAGILGSPGQANYAAANAFLDALAQHRRAAGLPGRSIAWGLWDRAGGMGGRLDEARGRRLRRSGVRALAPEHALRLFDAVLGEPDALSVPVELDLDAVAETGIVPPPLRDLVPVRSGPPVASGPRGLRQRLAETPDDAEEILLELVRGEVATVLGYGPHAGPHAGQDGIDTGRRLLDLGFDSLTGVDLRNRLTAATGLPLAATVVFDHPTVAALAAHLHAELMPDGAATALAVLDELGRLEHDLGKVSATLDTIARTRLAATLARMTARVAEAEQPASDKITALSGDFTDLIA